MYDHINAFGTTCPRGSNVRVSFDRNMHRIHAEAGAAFVLELSVGRDGHVFLRQAGASSEQGLVLSTARQNVDIQIGRIVDLGLLLRYKPASIAHPSRPGKLSFKHQGLAGVGTVFSLTWEVGVLPVTPAATPAGGASDFVQTRNFNQLAGKGRRVQVNSNLWLPVFNNQEDAAAFARYVGGFARRVVPGAATRADARWSDKSGGFVAELSCQFPGWGVERGDVLCHGQEVAGLAIQAKKGNVLLPLKGYSHTLRTEKGTLYVLFLDGSAFCRSATDGACPPADALYFAASYAEACNVYDRGGVLEVTKVPTRGCIPIYVNGAVRPMGNLIRLESRSFRRGQRVVSMLPE
jgi:hypothetical protein